MKIAINKKGLFAERWISYCKENNIYYKTVNCYDDDIVKQLSDCNAFMWHHSHASSQDVQFAKQLLFSLEQAGMKVFPNFKTTWHFDDKVGQKYLLEAINAPFVPSYVFYSKKEALSWVESITFPKVFKLRGGAGSANVRLVKTKHKAKRLISKAFGSGFAQYNKFGSLKDRWGKYRLGKTNLFDVLKGCVRIFYTTDFARNIGNERGYVYFQDFIPDNKYDIRIVVIEDRAFGLKRIVRKNDFRASGSGNIIYNKSEISEDCVKIAFDINKKLKTQCVAIDFVFNGKQALIVEISYGFLPKGYDSCEGYWDNHLNWHEGKINPYGWMIENLLRKIPKNHTHR